MSNPPSRYNKYSNYYLLSNKVDYNLMAPLNTPGYSFPCKGYVKGPDTATINGRTISITLEGVTTHGGGHCQFGISYNDVNFLVLKTVLTNCLLTGMTYTFDVPNNTPNGDVTIFWTWVNAIGNREYYMECADVLLNTGNDIGGDIYGKELLVVNLPGYTVIPEFPNVGMYSGLDLFEKRKDIFITQVPMSPTLPILSGSTSPVPLTSLKPTTPTTPTPKRTPKRKPKPTQLTTPKSKPTRLLSNSYTRNIKINKIKDVDVEVDVDVDVDVDVNVDVGVECVDVDVTVS